MKRTKQRADRDGQNQPEHVSGCRQFEGEDLSKFNFHIYRVGRVSDTLNLANLGLWVFENSNTSDLPVLTDSGGVLNSRN